MRYVALLRGVNVGGRNMVAMAEVREAITTMGFSGVTTLLQSGNVVFHGPVRAPIRLERQLEAAIEQRFGLKADVHVRTPDEWSAVIASNPFQVEAKKDPGRLLVTLFRAPLDAAKVEALRNLITGPERLHADGRHLYMFYPAGMGNSKAARLVDRTLGAAGTARNWNTVMKLATLLTTCAD